MSPRSPRWPAAIAAAAVLLCAAAARADAQVAYPAPGAGVQFYAVATQAGVISLLFFGAQGTPVVYYERVGDRLVSLGPSRSAAARGGSPTTAAACAR
jgi:hypothetical protein